MFNWLKLLIISFLFVGCGTERVDLRSPNPPTKWKSVAKIHLKAEMPVGDYSLAETQNITYVSAQVNTFTLDTGSLGPVSETNGTLDLGSIDISNLVVNNLDQCGTGTDRCTSARIALYTTELTGYTGISGFVNTDDSYGVPVVISATTGGASGTAGLTDTNAYGIETLDISSTSIRRINKGDFTTGPYLITSDFTNAGVGNYEMDLVIDLQLGD